MTSYEPLHPGVVPGHYRVDDQEGESTYHFIPEKTPLTDVKTPSIVSSAIPPVRDALEHAVKGDEEPKVPLKRSILPLLLSFLIHLIPTASTIAIVQLSIFNVFWFDNDSQSDRIPWKGIGGRISLNELLNSLQFVAKIHEILLVGSLSAMVMHRVRNRLIGRHGLPFGLLTAGYSVGSAEYLFSGAFRSGFNRRFWLLSILVIAFTLLANTLGPASAIALVPNLDWWPMKTPFSTESLPVVFGISKTEWWPLYMDQNQTLLADGAGGFLPTETCFTSTAFDVNSCPASGWEELSKWTSSNANLAIPANVTMQDGLSPAQRIVMSRLTARHGTIPGVAITTSLSHTFMTVMGAFWEQIRSRNYPVKDVIRPKLQLINNQSSYQPLVQVQCLPVLLQEINALTTRNNSVGDNYDINTFSTRNASRLPIPDYLYDFEYDPPHTIFLDDLGQPSVDQQQSINLTWMDYSDQPGYNLSLAAIVTTPANLYLHTGDTNQSQTAVLHFCSVDARWIASNPEYDPVENTIISHNVTDPLIFQRPKGADEKKYASDMDRWGVSPALKLTLDWAEALNIPAELENLTGDAFQWLLNAYILQVHDGGQNLSEVRVNYTFNPAINVADNTSFLTQDINNYVMTASETVATTLGLLITDGLSRIQVSQAQLGDIITKHVNDTTVTATWLAGLTGLNAIDSTRNVSAVSVAELPTSYTFKVSRYGYGYGFTTTTVYFGVAILLSHTLLAIIYIAYALYDYLFVTRWTSSAWGGVGELIALLINSKPTAELQNTCAGIDSRDTWRKRIGIREVGEGHLSVVVGEEEDLAMQPKVRRGVAYGTLDTTASAGIVRRRRQSI